MTRSLKTAKTEARNFARLIAKEVTVFQFGRVYVHAVTHSYFYYECLGKYLPTVFVTKAQH